ncbi:MAG: IS1634 family transposase [SAR324 cluster bacterium]|nr:IS1634 family transposase [SAR324 cluster bacterium]
MGLTLSSAESSYTSKNLDHLGLVAQMCRELEIAETINRSIPSGDKKVSNGDAVVAMIINGLGFTSQPMYLSPSFFSDKPVDRLIHPDLSASDLNARSLGRTLDYIFDYGPTELFSSISRKAVLILGLSPKNAHLDSSSFHLHGAYENQSPPLAGQEIISITHGYSRDHRPDLKQLILNMIVENKASLPIFMESASGNSTDKDDFRRIVVRHIENLQNATGIEYVIADSALYVEETIQAIASSIFFITRVPETIKGIKSLYRCIDLDKMISIDDNYSYMELGGIYGGIPQRWIVVYSSQAQKRTLQTFRKQLKKKIEQQLQTLTQLQSQSFACQEDAQQAVDDFQKKNHYLRITSLEFIQQAHYAHKGRPKLNEKPSQLTHSIQATVCSALDTIQEEQKLLGFFILATNQLDAQALPAEEVLNEYKGQSKVERGFKFLKSSEFLADSFYLKTTARIQALLMVMTLCLMVYSALQYRMRQALQQEEAFVENQLGKPVQNPTARWIFHIFGGIHVLYVDHQENAVLNLQQKHINILNLLGEAYKQIYQKHYSPPPTYRHHLWG